MRLFSAEARTGLYLFIAALPAACFLASCGNSPSGSQKVSYSIGGTVANLATGDTVQLQDNGGDTLSVNANGAFAFATKLATGSSYSVTVSAQPTSPAQTCGVTNGTGVVAANVTNVDVDCGHGEWTWMNGSSTVNQAGTYGTEGTATPGNVPGAREVAAAWTDDASGNFWLFGGFGYDSTGTAGDLDDLWKYSGGEWTWMSGSNATNQAGTYGTKGTAAPGNVPGAREVAATWTDASGNLWLFGGLGYDSTGTTGDLSDLWKYSGGEWTWMSGSNAINQGGTYGTEGAAMPGSVPGARGLAVSWTDPGGNLWLFGGAGYDSKGAQGHLNDLWKYEP
jgi:N-acetylneuraminic acid mutarotase